MNAKSSYLVIFLAVGIAFSAGLAEASEQKQADLDRYTGTFFHYWGELGKFPGEKGEDKIDIRLANGALTAVYTGIEDYGEEGTLYYRSVIKKITVLPDGRLQFRMPPRTLYGKAGDIGSDKNSGASKPDALYIGTLVDKGIQFTCGAEAATDWPQEDCPEKHMLFKRSLR